MVPGYFTGTIKSSETIQPVLLGVGCCTWKATHRHRFVDFCAPHCSLATGLDAHGGNVQNGCGARFNWNQAKLYVGDRGTRKKKVRVIKIIKAYATIGVTLQHFFSLTGFVIWGTIRTIL